MKSDVIIYVIRNTHYESDVIIDAIPIQLIVTTAATTATNNNDNNNNDTIIILLLLLLLLLLLMMIIIIIIPGTHTTDITKNPHRACPGGRRGGPERRGRSVSLLVLSCHHY